MEDQLQEWQQANGAEPGDKPDRNQWYYDKRIECIEAGLITTDFGWDVVRSWLNSVAAKQSKAQAVDVD